MFNWYYRARTCYGYLADVTADTTSQTFRDFPNDRELTDQELGILLSSSLARSRWFTRGWTLQELIAPVDVKFYSKDWQLIGEKSSLSLALAQITMVDEEVLLNRRNVESICVARKMSWAAGRETSRVEDAAYSLLGIFGIAMPMLYGEGNRAFFRLQEEIVKISDDESIFAWDTSEASEHSLFAPQPSCFSNASNIVRHRKIKQHAEPWTLTNVGLRIRLPLVTSPHGPSDRFAILACGYEDNLAGPIALQLNYKRDNLVFEAPLSNRLAVVEIKQADKAGEEIIYIKRKSAEPGKSRLDLMRSPMSFLRKNPKCCIRIAKPLRWTPFEVLDAFPRRFWNLDSMTVWIRRGNKIKAALYLVNPDGKELVVAFGYDGVKTADGSVITPRESCWIHLVKPGAGKTLEQMCVEALPVSMHSYRASAAMDATSTSWGAYASIKEAYVMDEKIFMVDVQFTGK